MNKLVLSALAATVCVGTTNASEGDWAGLDSELSALTTSMVKDGPSVGGYLEATYDTDGDIWGTGRNRVTVSGDNGGYGYHVSLQGSEGADAYITFTMGGIGWTMGDFRAPGTSNHLADENDTTFMDRDAIGGGGARSHGLMASGNMDALGYMVHVGNGNELSARVTYDVMSGDGVILSLAYSMDDTADTSHMEADVSSGPFGIHATMGDSAGGDGAMVLVASYDVNDTWAIAIRSTDLDDGSDETMDWAVTYGDGAARWTFQTNDDDDLTVGCIVGF